MTKILKAIAGVIVGMLVAFALIIATEGLSAIVHPFPEGFEGTSEEVVEHVANYPDWVLLLVVPIWGFTALIGTWVARRIGGQAAAIIVGSLLVLGVLFNISQLPYPMWFKIVIVIAVLIAVQAGIRQPVSTVVNKE